MPHSIPRRLALWSERHPVLLDLPRVPDPDPRPELDVDVEPALPAELARIQQRLVEGCIEPRRVGGDHLRRSHFRVQSVHLVPPSLSPAVGPTTLTTASSRS